VGDVVTVDGWLARDGSKLMNAKTVMLGGQEAVRRLDPGHAAFPVMYDPRR